MASTTPSPHSWPGLTTNTTTPTPSSSPTPSQDPFQDGFSNLTLQSPFPVSVDVGVGTEIAALLVLAVGVVGNLVVMLVFLWRPWGRTPLQVDRVIGLLALSGLATTLVSMPFHLYSFSTSQYPASQSMCQVQGFLLNLLCLLSLWYTAVLAVERYVKFASPHEHTLTFSLLNLNVVLSGVLVLLLIEVSGPIYGWAEYGYVQDCGVCVLNPQSTHIFTYAVIQTSCYIVVPVLVTVCSNARVLCELFAGEPAPLLRGSQVFKSVLGMTVLCCAMLFTIVLTVPYHTLLMLQSTDVPIPAYAKEISYWLKMVGLTCVYPAVLLLARPKEVWPTLMATLHSLKKCRFRRYFQNQGRDLDLSSITVSGGANGGSTSGGGRGGGSDSTRSKSRRFSRTSHVTDSTVLSAASPSRNSKDLLPNPDTVSRLPNPATVSRL